MSAAWGPPPDDDIGYQVADLANEAERVSAHLTDQQRLRFVYALLDAIRDGR